MGLSLLYSFSFFPPNVLIKLIIFQIMYLIIGVYNTKTEPKNQKIGNFLANVYSLKIGEKNLDDCMAHYNTV